MPPTQNQQALKGDPETLTAIDGNVIVGKDILELLSSSMYLDPITIYREYVQNSADAIDLTEGWRGGRTFPFMLIQRFAQFA